MAVLPDPPTPPTGMSPTAFHETMLEEAAYWQQARHQQMGNRLVRAQAQELVGRGVTSGRLRRSSRGSDSGSEPAEALNPEEEAYWVNALRLSSQDEHSPSSVSGIDELLSARRVTPKPIVCASWCGLGH